jgi:hypothetical protein
LTGKCPASPALQDGAKGHNVKKKLPYREAPPFRAGASILTRSTAFSLFFENAPGKRLSELALSEVEGVNLEQVLVYGSRQSKG